MVVFYWRQWYNTSIIFYCVFHLLFVCCADHTQLKSTIAEFQEVLELERKRHSELKVETETSKRELVEQVTRSGATQRKLEVMLAGKN